MLDERGIEGEVEGEDVVYGCVWVGGNVKDGYVGDDGTIRLRKSRKDTIPLEQEEEGTFPRCSSPCRHSRRGISSWWWGIHLHA